jgi:DNA-binding response OmpR family regulator
MKEDRSEILVIDGGPEDREALAQILRGASHRVRAASSGTEALREARDTPPDLIILDIDMPQMDGFEVFRRLTDELGLANIPVIFMTGVGALDDRARAYRCGGSDCIVKPLVAEEVVARVEAQLLRARLEELEERRDERTRMLVHDLRSPVSAMLTYLELLQTDLSLDLSPQHADDLGRVRECAVRLANMLTEVLDATRSETKKSLL